MDRRTVLGLGAAAAALLTAPAESGTPVWSPSLPDPSEIVPLWPGTPPGGEGVNLTLTITERSTAPSEYRDRAATNIAIPTLSVFRPANPDGSAVLIAPGGGYSRVVLDKEGYEAARRLNESGVTAFILLYRLPGEGWAHGADVPLQDAQRAMRVIRAGATRFGIDGARLGVLGFSAGGHVAASLATRFGAAVYASVDAADAQDARPAFAAMLYPVISMLKPVAHEASREKLLGKDASQALREAYSCQRLVGATTPPSFLCAAADDRDVPIENTLGMFASLRAAHVPAEMHIFEEGGHGFGIRLAAGKPAFYWPDLLLHWLAQHGIVRGA